MKVRPASVRPGRVSPLLEAMSGVLVLLILLPGLPRAFVGHAGRVFHGFQS